MGLNLVRGLNFVVRRTLANDDISPEWKKGYGNDGPREQGIAKWSPLAIQPPPDVRRNHRRRNSPRLGVVGRLGQERRRGLPLDRFLGGRFFTCRTAMSGCGNLTPYPHWINGSLPVQSISADLWHCATITCNVLDPWPFFVTAPAACFCTAFLRANRLISFWSLVLSLILGEWFTAAAIVYSCGYETLFQLLGFQNSDAFFRELALHQCFPKRFPGQLWYIGAPWLLGIVVGEIMAQRRKPSGGERQRV